MRKTIEILVALVLIAALNIPKCLYAQGVSLGIKGGLNMASIIGADAGSPNMKSGLVGGTYAAIDLMFVDIQPEVLYSQKGVKQDVTVHYNYLEIPVLFKFPLGKIIVPSIYTGPYFGMLINANIEGVDIKDGLKSNDLGLVFGVDVKTPLKLSVDARYTMGLTSFDDAGVYDVKNSVISLMIGYSIL